MKRKKAATEPTELINPSSLEEMINFNRTFVIKEKLPFHVDRKVLNAIMSNVNARSDIVDTRFRVIRKASNILAGIVARRPFAAANIPSGIFLAVDFLEDNGFQLSLESIEELYEIIDENSSEEEIRNDSESFLLQYVKD